MSIITESFDRVGELYGIWFADLLHVHFLIRTVIILFILWLIIFLAAQTIHYVIAPLFLMIYYHIFFRAWNYIFVETLHEWIYIRYASKDKPNFSSLYLSLCDKVKINRMKLSHTKYKRMIKRSRKFSMTFMYVSAIATTLWVSAFGLHQEYAAPVMYQIVENKETENEEILQEPLHESPKEPTENVPPVTEKHETIYDEVTPFYTENYLYPADWQDSAILTLNEQGSQGARLRDGPGIEGQTVIEILWDDAELKYLNNYVPDEYINGLYWLQVESPTGTIGYISSQIIDTK